MDCDKMLGGEVNSMPLSALDFLSALSTVAVPGSACSSVQSAHTPPELRESASRLFSSTWMNPNQDRRTPQPTLAERLFPGSRQPKLALINPPSDQMCSIPLLRAPLNYDADRKMALKVGRDIDPEIVPQRPAVCPESGKP
jgi:hypothetical protein